MKISIIIPIYNVEPYVERCLKSVMAQTYQGPIECLIVDDYGTDNSMDVVERVVNAYQGLIVFKIIHHEHNRGLSAARNTGMDAATGDYLFFLDSDDEISKNCIEALASPLNEELYDLVVGSITTSDNEGFDKWVALKLKDGDVLRGKDIENTYPGKWNCMSQNKLYRTAFIRKNMLRFKDNLIHEDELWSIQVACLAQSLRAVNQNTYLYYIREKSLTTASYNEDRKCKMLKVIVAEIAQFLKNRHIFSARAYQIMQQFFWQSLKFSLGERDCFIKDYTELRAKSSMPILYRIFAIGVHPSTQLRNIYYLLPSKIAAKILYYRIHKSSRNT